MVVDRALATGLFHRAARPLRAATRSPFHPMSRDFATADGRWIRFQANYPHLRAAALAVLGTSEDGAAIASAVAGAKADELESAVVAGGGAAASRTAREWSVHPQGAAVAAEPLVDIAKASVIPASDPGGRDMSQRGRLGRGRLGRGRLGRRHGPAGRRPTASAPGARWPGCASWT